MTPERFEAAKKRYEASTTTLICDTPEKAAAHGVPIGTTVIFRSVPEVVTNAQNSLDDCYYREWLRNGGQG